MSMHIVDVIINIKIDKDNAMKITDILVENNQEQTPLYVSNRDFELAHESDKHPGYIMGVTYHDDDDVIKTDMDVYKFIRTDEFEWNGKKFKQDKYQYLGPVIDPKTGSASSPYLKMSEYIKMFDYTVDEMVKGNIKPHRIPVVNIPTDLKEDIAGMTAVNLEKIKNNFDDTVVRDLSRSHGNSVLFTRDKSGNKWKIVKTTDGKIYVEREFMLEGDSIIFEGINKAVAGVIVDVTEDSILIEGGTFPITETDMLYEDDMIAVNETVHNFTIDDIKQLEKSNDFNDVKRQAISLITKPSKRPISPEKQAWLKNEILNKKDKIAVIKLMYDLMLGGEGMKVIGSKSSYRRKFDEDNNGDRRSFTVKMKFEDGGKVTRVFLAKNKDDALSNAMKWAKKEYDPTQDVDAKVIAESDAAKAITQAFGGMAAGVKTGLIRRAGLLAMQGRHSEAENTIRHLLKDLDSGVADKIRKSINDINPVKIGDRIADTSSIEKSKAHTDWLDKTFVPWVEKHISSNLSEREGDWAAGAGNLLKALAFLIGVPIITAGQIWKSDLPIVDSPLGKAMYDAAARGDKSAEEALKRLDDIGVQRLPMQYIEKLSDKYLHKGKLKESIEYQTFKNALIEAKYKGREVKLGKPMAGDVKKYKVYVRDPKTGNIKKVNFGDKGMEIKRDDPKRRKSFRARHGCGTPRASNRLKAAYWSCRMWSSKPVSKILKGK